MVCKDFEKFQSSPCMDVVSVLWNIDTLNFLNVPLCMGVYFLCVVVHKDFENLKVL